MVAKGVHGVVGATPPDVLRRWMNVVLAKRPAVVSAAWSSSQGIVPVAGTVTIAAASTEVPPRSCQTGRVVTGFRK